MVEPHSETEHDVWQNRQSSQHFAVNTAMLFIIIIITFIWVIIVIIKLKCLLSYWEEKI